MQGAFANAEFPGEIAESQAFVSPGDQLDDLKSLFHGWCFIHV
jgi:hypothetical protein